MRSADFTVHAPRFTIIARCKSCSDVFRPELSPSNLLTCAAGYGNSGPNNCAAASVVLVVQTIFGLLLDAITIGALFTGLRMYLNFLLFNAVEGASLCD